MRGRKRKPMPAKARLELLLEAQERWQLIDRHAIGLYANEAVQAKPGHWPEDWPDGYGMQRESDWIGLALQELLEDSIALMKSREGDEETPIS